MTQGRRHRPAVVFVGADVVQEALGWMARFRDKRLSLTDCASFELMERLGIAAAFTFDRDFRDRGFRTLP